MQPRRKHWGWGYEHEQPSPEELRATATFLAAHLGFGDVEPEAPAPLTREVTVGSAAQSPRASAGDLCSG